MITSKEYSPFLQWNPPDRKTVGSVAPPFVSLVSMVRDGFEFGEDLLQKSSKFLSSLISLFETNDSFDDFLKAVGQDSPNPAAVILSTPHLRDLSVVEDKVIMNDILSIFKFGVWLVDASTVQFLSITSDTDPQSIRGVVLHEVLIPMEPSLVQISRNPHLLSWIDEYKDTLRLLINIFDMSAFHQPTLDFVCSSRIPMVFQSLLSKVEYKNTHQFIIWLMTSDTRTWKRDGAETWRRGRILLQTLEQEGFRDHLEQTLLHDKSPPYGRFVREYSYDLMNDLGLNTPQPL
ncbi:hypothetical protein BLNAU_3211 [Blattamonas nauphoetae]|uniref:Uncharacterized protein n=1 Tax=Blattamonas nauphoetae TaxID=2049346 RepID=A0ABQ9YDV8_9EUKA|nr:hypothetical protein BLNAU_3211 [Blattamonas nauphoetae]